MIIRSRKDKSEGQGQPSPGVRLQRVLAAAGVGARRVCERLIEEGHVKVNGETVSHLPAFVNPGQDRITVDGQAITLDRSRHLYVMLNKPERMLVTASDEPGMDRATVMDLVDHPGKKRLFPVGRLDYNTSGLVLLTSDGELANRLTHPRYGVPKVYRALVKGTINPLDLPKVRASMLKDVQRDDRAAARVRPARRPRSEGGIELRIAGRDQGRTILEIELREGRTGNPGTMLAAAGLHVRKLERIAIGPLMLSGLSRGRWRELEREEIRDLRRAGKGDRPARPARPAGDARPMSRRRAARQRSSQDPR
jgi:23S rRNA pseudouridine2605 synthase